MFATHKLNDNGFAEVRKMKVTLATAVSEVLTQLPDGREKSIFLTKIEEAVFFAAKSLAQKDENHTEKTEY